MVKNNQTKPVIMLTKANTNWLKADIVFFSFLKKETVDYKKYLPKTVYERNIVGVAKLPPYFSNRLGFFNEQGQTFFCSNIPLVFSFLNYPQLDKTTIAEYWNQVMSTSQSGVCPRVWILAPKELCEFLLEVQIRESNENFCFYEPEEEKDRYFAIEDIGKKIDVHFLF